MRLVHDRSGDSRDAAISAAFNEQAMKFIIGLGPREEIRGVAESEMLDPEDVAGVVLLACTQSPKSRIIEVQMRTMAEALA